MKEDRLRKENTVWTVSEDYSFKPLLDLFDSYGDRDMDYYKMLVLGYGYGDLYGVFVRPLWKNPVKG